MKLEDRLIISKKTLTICQWPFVYSLETQFINHTILLSADAIYDSLNSSLTQMHECSCSLSDFKSHFECYSFVVAFVIGESH